MMTEMHGYFEPSPSEVWRLYEQGRSFKESIGLFDTVATNENFFIGKQWEGVSANGLPTPVFNILKRDVCFVVSNITSDNLTARVSGCETDSKKLPEDVINGEVRHLMEQNNMPGLLRTMARDAAVRGDGCLYTYWDVDTGRIVTEPVENTRVYFGNPNDRRVQTQPYIIIESRQLVYKVRREAMDNSETEWESIMPDDDRSGVDFEGIFALDAERNVVDPVSFDAESGVVAFAYPESMLNIFIPDKSGNTLQIVITV